MIDILTVGSAASFGEFRDEMAGRDDTHLICVDSGAAALDRLMETPVELVVIDEALPDMSGRDLAQQVAVRCPLSGVALVSGMPPEEFHEATEGLGVLAQLPSNPGREDARHLLNKLSHILQMTQTAGG